MNRFLFFAVAAVLFTAYSKDALDEQQGIQNIVDEAPATLTVGFEDDETRIQLNEEQNTVWTKGDLVSVFYRSDANQQWQYTGETGEDEGENMVGGAGDNLVFEDTVLTEVTLNCLDGTSPTEKGVTLGAEATAFYIALPPQTFTKGITVEITDTNNFTMTQSTDKEVVIERNHIKPMAAFKFVNPNTPTISTPANNEIWYTATAKVEPYDKTVFGATYVSNEWDSETGKGVITFSRDVTKIGNYAFFDCSSLTSVTIPDSVTTIGERAFSRCNSLTSVTIGDSVTTIGWWAFEDCNSLTSVTIDNSVTTIGEAAFRDCTSLTSVTIPDSVTTIGEEAFRSCTSLTSVTIGNSVTTIGEYAFHSCKSLTSVTIPDSVTTIGSNAFYYCTSLTSVTIGDSVTTIGRCAFNWCTSLKEFKGKFAADNGRCLIMDNTIIAYAEASGTTYTIPDSVTTIGNSAFWGCTSLTSVTIGNSVTTIGKWAFYNCTSLKTVYCKPTTPPTGGINMFYTNASERKIYVPASDDDSIINAYKAKQYWSNYADFIFEEE